MHHHATFGYKRLSGSGGILLTKPEQTDIQTHGQTDTGKKLCSLRSVNQDGYIRVEGGHKDTVNPGIKKNKRLKSSSSNSSSSSSSSSSNGI